ncbi:ribosomal-protein-alanine N-acetyltransferase [Loktanella atrilutea]|uniref:Ribosomal-protein-alanine N-acetyltransferase n=1 Tax=Loktanella atrilutea TaxID=366533 RepID=A0A1M4T9M8_LOKAT|nr:ribosomal-protein-alanine N-acetyltransferase [Loktanella atrilutea]
MRTPRLTLRRARQTDLNDLFAVFSDPRAMQYWSTLPHADRSVTQDRLDRMMTHQPLGYFVIDRDGRAIGCAGLYDEGEVGFILHPDHWQQGLMTEAMQAIIPYLFANHDFDRLIADIDPRNAGSAATLRKLGFHETHRAARTYFIGGVWSDSAYYALPRPAAPA